MVGRYRRFGELGPGQGCGTAFERRHERVGQTRSQGVFPHRMQQPFGIRGELTDGCSFGEDLLGRDVSQYRPKFVVLQIEPQFPRYQMEVSILITRAREIDAGIDTDTRPPACAGAELLATNQVTGSCLSAQAWRPDPARHRSTGPGPPPREAPPPAPRDRRLP